MTEQIAGLTGTAATAPPPADGEPSSPARPGLRERKKLRTYETIATVALGLFDKQGFRATTIAQIADAADVSPRTVSAYFPVKEDLLFPHSAEAFDALAVRLQERPAGELAVDALRAWIGELFDAGNEKRTPERERVRRRVIEAEESLRAHERHLMARAERLLASAIAQDLGTADDDVAPRLAAAAAVGALTAIGRVQDERGLPDDPQARRDAVLALIDQAIAFLRGGIRELREAG